MIVDLIEAGKEKTLKLNFCDRPETIDSHTKSRTHNSCLCQRCIHDSILPIFCLKSIGDPEDASLFSNILAQDYDTLIPFHLFSKSQVDRLYHI